MSDIVNAVAEHSAKQSERSVLADEMNTLVRGGDKFTAENKTRCDEITVLIDGDPSKGIAGLDREIHALSMQIANKPVSIVEDVKIVPSVFQRYMVEGPTGLTESEKSDYLVEGSMGKGFRLSNPKAALDGPTSGNTSTSGQGVGIDVYNKVIDSLLHFGGVREMVYQFGTTQGNLLHVPNWDTTTEKGTLVGPRNTVVDDTPTAVLGETPFGAYTYSSDSFGVGLEYLKDAAFDLESLIPMRLMRRIGRINNEHFTTGDNVSKPQGLVEGASDGVTTGSTSFTYENLVDMIHAVDPAYREGMEATSSDGGLTAEMGKVGFMFNDDVIQAAKKLEDTHGRPLWLPNMGIAAGAPNTLLGYPYSINQNLDTIASGNTPALFGNFGYYGVRNVQSMTFHRFTDSAFALKNQIGFVAFARGDGRYMGGFDTNSKCEAVVKMTMA